MLKEFRPTILFLFKFGVVFALGSIAYSYFIRHYQQLEPPQTDPVTHWVAVQVNSVVRAFGYDANLWYPENEPLVVVYIKGFENENVTFYEGCNGINIMILFLAFVIAFGEQNKARWWFIPAGLVAIHIFNLARLASLCIMATWSESAFHFFHKFAFTGVIYAFVLFLWYLWATRYSKLERSEK